eukprot:TRINITY_DN4196_c0_g1_i1.p1 TRINITY_DN4196_c0_g1~~TRINITY_DN4196_c0_g1_i1.p1  ORF type:complete len:321 (+),score=63.83 TRINITY_DN4196_c0_g1_i1:122-1084(+)
MGNNTYDKISILVRGYTELEIESNDKNWDQISISILLSLVEKQFTPIKKKRNISIPISSIVRGRNLYAAEYTRMKNLILTSMETNISNFYNFVVCYGYFEYLTGSIEKAGIIYKESLDFLRGFLSKPSFGMYTDYNIYEEKLLLSYVSLYRTNKIVNKNTPPSMLREALEFAMERYPTNYVFLTMFFENEYRTYISGRLRLFFDQICAKSESSLLWLFSLITETKEGSSNRKKNLFERALHPEQKTSRSVQIWKEYIKFQKQQGKVSGTYYRALRSTPWAKDIWMEGFRMIGSVDMEVEELHQIVGAMAEKEIRIRTEPI